MPFASAATAQAGAPYLTPVTSPSGATLALLTVQPASALFPADTQCCTPNASFLPLPPPRMPTPQKTQELLRRYKQLREEDRELASAWPSAMGQRASLAGVGLHPTSSKMKWPH